MASTSARIASTGRSVLPTSHHTSTASTSVTTGMATAKEVARIRLDSSMSARVAPTWITFVPARRESTR